MENKLFDWDINLAYFQLISIRETKWKSQLKQKNETKKLMWTRILHYFGIAVCVCGCAIVVFFLLLEWVCVCDFCMNVRWTNQMF